MKSWWVVLGILVATASGAQTAPQSLRGSGATTMTELLAQWSKGQGATLPPLKYSPSGSSAGRSDVSEGKVDFAASEQPFSAAELQKFGLRQFPIVFTAIVPVVNLPAVAPGALRLDGPTLAGIFAGKIRRWNDPALTALNRELNLPALDIAPIARADGSGSTLAFTSYLSDTDEQWRQSRGAATRIKDFGGVVAEGTGGVLRAVQARPGAIGYAALGSAQQAGVSIVQLRTPTGVWVLPSAESVGAAVGLGDWQKHLLDDDPAFDVSLINLLSKRAWPITTATYAIVPRRLRGSDPRTTLRFFQWGIENGADAARAAGFIPVDDRLAFKIKLAWEVGQAADRGAVPAR
jgi:phosphate transport system substrate-binding protein